MARDPYRFRLARAGVLNVWQYDEQVFVFEDGRLLLRGTNGAGKSKTLEMLLPFVIDADRQRMAATGRQGTQLLWLMSDGATGGGTRTGYLWVELTRVDERGEPATVTCGVGVRSSSSARTATLWAFTVPAGVPPLCEGDGTPLSQPRCREVVDVLGGHFFESPRAYREHVGRLLFGLQPQAYDDLLRLLYWLRQPQVGEDIDPRRLVEMLDEALPALDEDAVRNVGESFDDLAEFGRRVEALEQSAAAVQGAATVYGQYATGLVASRAGEAVAAQRERVSRARTLSAAERTLRELGAALNAAAAERAAAGAEADGAGARARALEGGPLTRHQQVLDEKQRRAGDLAAAAVRAQGWARQAVERSTDAAARVVDEAARLRGAVTGLAVRVREVAASLHGCGLRAGLPVLVAAADETTSGADAGPAARAGSAADELPDLAAAVGPARAEVSMLLAAVTVVRASLAEAERRYADRTRAAERSADADTAEEQAAGRLADADLELSEQQRRWLAAARSWVVEQPALRLLPVIASRSGACVLVVGETGPALATADSEDERTVDARLAAEPELERLRDVELAAGSRRSAVDALLRDLSVQREQVLAERDPAPPPPALSRSDRDPERGTTLWRLVDIRPGTDVAVAARVEAALQAAGLLDAQVLASGAVLPAGALDTVLVASSAPAEGPSLLDQLRADVPDDSPVPADVVERVLAAVALVDADAEAFDGPALGRDGSWRLGPLAGRAVKAAAQYVGAAARQAERARRMADVERMLATAQADRDEAAGQQQEANRARVALEQWLARQPDDRPVRDADTRREERAGAAARARSAARSAADVLAQVTAEAARAAGAVRRLAAEHGLPDTREPLEARASELADLDRRLDRLGADAARLVDGARRLEEDAEGAEQAAEQAARVASEAVAAQADARQAAEESQALRDTLGVEVQRLQDQLAAARHAHQSARARRQNADVRVLELTGRQGAQQAGVAAAAERLAEAEPLVVSSAAAVRALLGVPGLLPAALGRPVTEDERAGLEQSAPSEAVHVWAELQPVRAVDANAVHAEVRSLAAGPAADREPRVVPVGAGDAAALAVLARDDAGVELPLAQAGQRLGAAVQQERELLTDRERTLFEEHLLGELGEALRRRRAEAADLVRGMNDLLAGVRTSQGIRVRLDWELRDDAGPQVREAVALLGRAHGSLDPDERARLRNALGGLLEVQRSAEPEEGYTEHLARALDYRRWSAFAVRLSRPNMAGWSTLTRRTPLSQGEQKVVCYLPLFAAAAAHFTSVAGAAPYAPRLILLDDAFPKIDVRTHPLLFGLLVDLDLDFVLTSERLWGDHATVPSLAVYEALRAPGERGIAQYRYVWDGNTLVGEGG